MPEVADGTRLLQWGEPSMGYGERHVYLKHVLADSGFFDIFSFPVLRGDDAPEVLAINRLDDTFSASAAVVGEEIYLRGERRLYRLSRR